MISRKTKRELTFIAVALLMGVIIFSVIVESISFLVPLLNKALKEDAENTPVATFYIERYKKIIPEDE